MKKKSILAMLLAVSMFAGGASLTGCKILGGNGDTNQTETVSVTGVTLNTKTLEIEVNGTQQLVANVAPKTATNKTCKWSSSDPTVVSVSSSGKITGKSVGVATITVTTDDGAKTDVCEVTVRSAKTDTSDVAVTGVTVDPTSLKLTVGGSGKLTAKVAPSDATNKNVSWVSGDPDTASVSEDGTVTAKKEGTAKITVTTEDGGKTAICTVTVNAESSGKDPENPDDPNKDPDDPNKDPDEGDDKPTVTQYDVTFVSGGVTVSTAKVEKGGKAQPYNATKDGFYLEGWSTSATSGQLYDFDTPVNGPLTLYAVWREVTDQLAYNYAGNECAAFEWKDANPAQAKVEYKLHGASGYTQVDSALVRESATAGTARADAVGLKGNANYDFKVTASDGKVYTQNNMFIAAYDRSGYAHFKAEGVGAYNDDGTPKSGAKIYYVTESNKNNVVDSTGNSTNKSVVELLQSQKGGSPMIIRVIGTVGCATWKEGKITYTKTLENTVNGKIENGKVVGNLKPEAIVDKNGNPLEKRDYDQSELKGTHNDLDTSVYSEIRNISSTIKWDSSKQEFDSCWNDASISGAQNVTVEGIGEDARIFQWGMTFKNSSSIEVRNLTFEDYTEDACSFEGGSSNTSSSSADDFTYKNFWVHHNTFEEGVNYWDVCKEQDKHDGDGSTDIKRVAYVTFAYNVYHNTHKTGLVGSDDDVLTASVTFHHNLYDGCKARLPLARQANMHMYNNYYKGTTDTDISVRGTAYAFVENCYFEKATGSSTSNNFDLPDEKIKNGVGCGTGYAKVVNCVFADADGKTVAPKTKFGDSVPTTNLKLNASRGDKLNTPNKYGSNFDTDNSVFYYENGQSKVESMLAANEVKTKVPDLAGVQQRGKSVGSGGSSGGSGNTGTAPTDPETPTDPVTPPATEGKTVVIIDDFTDFSGKETNEVILTGNASGYIADNKITAQKPGSTLALGGNGLKLQSATKLNFSTATLSKSVKLIVNLSNTKYTGLSLTVNGVAKNLVADSDGNVTITLEANAVYQIGRAEGVDGVSATEALILSISLVI